MSSLVSFHFSELVEDAQQAHLVNHLRYRGHAQVQRLRQLHDGRVAMEDEVRNHAFSQQCALAALFQRLED